MNRPTKVLGILIFPNFESLDVFGPIEVFGSLPDKITIVIVAERNELIKSVHGQSIMPDYDLQNTPHLDVLLVPGGMGTRKEINNQTLLKWIKSRSIETDLTLSVCTGAALLARAGVLDNHKATTNKIAYNWVTEQGPKVEWIKKARWVDDGNVITSSGVSAGIDMSLYVISRLFGEEMRKEVSNIIEYIPNKDASLDPFSENQ